MGSSPPKVFISYSWTSPTHETWVLDLSSQLRERGVDVILDKWDLQPGHDAHAFMEKMVTDPDISKVAIICDREYARKANERKGGVGTETQIISTEIYAKTVQDKFVVVVREVDDDGQPCVPAYAKSRIHINLTDQTSYTGGFDQLLRWIFDKPLHPKPAIGSMPTHLGETTVPVWLSTATATARAIDAIKGDQKFAIPASQDYFETLRVELVKLQLEPGDDPFDDLVVESLDDFLPHRDEALTVFETIARYRSDEESWKALHRLFESLLPLALDTSQGGDRRDTSKDNFRFIVHELFLYCMAILIRHERFDGADYLMRYEYFIPGDAHYGGDELTPFATIRQHIPSLELRNRRLKQNRLSLRADYLKRRCPEPKIAFAHLLQADLVLFLRSRLDHGEYYKYWFPDTLLYADRRRTPFEVFARSRSKAYFERSRLLLGIDTKEQLKPLVEEFQSKPQSIPKWQFDSFSPITLMGYDDLCSKP